jgi:hypothetical protein
VANVYAFARVEKLSGRYAKRKTKRFSPWTSTRVYKDRHLTWETNRLAGPI